MIEMEIIGHISARRVLTPEGNWLYESPESHSFAVQCIFLKSAALPDLDGFIETLEDNASSDDEVKEARELRKLRSRAFQAYLDSDFDSMKERILLIDAHTSWKSYWEDREKSLLKLAIPHARVKSGAAEGGKIRGEQQSREKAEKDKVEIMRGRGNVSDTVKGLARRTDALGDWLELKEDLWLQLMGDLDNIGLRDVLESNAPHRITYKDGDGKPGEIKFTSFQRMVYTERGKCK